MKPMILSMADFGLSLEDSKRIWMTLEDFGLSLEDFGLSLEDFGLSLD